VTHSLDIRDGLDVRDIRDTAGSVIALAVYRPVNLSWLGALTTFACDVLDVPEGKLVVCVAAAKATGATMVFVSNARADELAVLLHPGEVSS